MRQRFGRRTSTSTPSSTIGSNAASRRDFKQRCEVPVGFGAMEANVRLQGWPSKVPIEDRPRRLQFDALVVAVEQLADTFDRAVTIVPARPQAVGRLRPAARISALLRPLHRAKPREPIYRGSNEPPVVPIQLQD
jgi:hypothetical protein